MIPGELMLASGTIEINANRQTVEVVVANTGDRPIQVGSHFHFFEVNKALEFNRAKAFGFRLDIPAGTAVRFEPGEEKSVPLVELGGKQTVYGLNGLTGGSVKSTVCFEEALARAIAKGFKQVTKEANTP